MSTPPANAAFGTVLGTTQGNVEVYSSDYKTVDETALPDRRAFRSHVDGVFMGYKWQCVELARRWLYVNRGYVFDEVSMAYEIFRLNSVRTTSGERLPLHSFRNGSRRPPVPGSLLIWAEGKEFEETGHVAIVTEVFPDRVRIVEQNYHHHVWPADQDYSREVAARTAYDGGFWLRCPPNEGTILGWVVQTDDAEFAESDIEPDRHLLDIHAHEAPDEGQAERSWLNEANPDEAAYVELEGHTLADSPDDQLRYFSISNTLEKELQRASNELHALFMHATDWVLQAPERLAPFNLPPALWSRITRSWDDRRNQMITGRFDFAVVDGEIKVFEYNCDSASCHMECGKLQGRWAEHFGVVESQDPGRDLFSSLVEAWTESEVEDHIHILHGDDPEEKYHAMYMREALETAGLDVHMQHGIGGLYFDDAGKILDADGRPVRWIWKTWAWETALDQIRQECEVDDLGLRRSATPRLADVLLCPDVRAFEPLWTLVPSNKAILPILWQLFPDHPYLLESSFECTSTLRGSGYVEKPIVGRWGDNITMYDEQSEVVGSTSGRFGAQNLIYQALRVLPRVSDRHVQLCTFTVAGLHAGTCTRVDPSPVITCDSEIWPLRVVGDALFTR